MKKAEKGNKDMAGRKATSSRGQVTPTKNSFKPNSSPKSGRRQSTISPASKQKCVDVEEKVVEDRVPVQLKRKLTSPEKMPAVKLKKLQKVESLLPDSVELQSVEGVDLEEHHIEGALQISQFLAAFTMPDDMKVGTARSILKELSRGGMVRRGVQSAVVQLHVALLTIIKNDMIRSGEVSPLMNGKDSWLAQLSECLVHHSNPPPGWTRLRRHKSTEVNGSPPDSGSGVDGTNGSDGEEGEEGRGEGNGNVEGVRDGDGDGEGEIREEDVSDVARVVRALRRGAEGYTALSLKEKLDLIVMLLHDALTTSFFRSQIEEAVADKEEGEKEGREEAATLRREAKEAKDRHHEEKKKEGAMRMATLKKKSDVTPTALRHQQAVTEEARVALNAANEKVAALANSRMTADAGCGIWHTFKSESGDKVDAYVNACKEWVAECQPKAVKVRKVKEEAPCLINKGGFKVYR